MAKKISTISTKLYKSKVKKVLAAIVAGILLIIGINIYVLNPATVRADTYLSLDEGYGTTPKDANGAISGATITGAVWRNDGMCLNQKCLYFDGDQDYISITDDADLDFAAADSFTIELWFRHAPKTSGTEILINKLENLGTDGGYEIQMESDGDITCQIEDDDADTTVDDSVTSTAATYDDNLWHHVSCVKNAATSLTLYIDGEQVGQDSSLNANSTLANNDIFYVGIDGDGTSNDYKGFIDEVKVYRTARTPSQIKTDIATLSPSRGASAVFGPDTSWHSNGLVGFWKMDESSWNGTSNEVIDISGNGYHGTRGGNATTAAGKYGRSGSFDGTGDYVTLGNTASLAGTDGITIATWIYPQENEGHIITRQLISAGSSRGYGLYSDFTGALYFSLTTTGTGSNSNAVFDTEISLTLNTWQHVAVTYDSNTSTTTSFLNGNLIATTTGLTTGKMADSADSATIGAESAAATYSFQSKIDELRLYGRSLNPTEIFKLYNWAPGPIGYWNFNENGGGTAYDRSTNNKNLISSSATSDTGFLAPTATGDDYNQWSSPTSAYSSDNAYASEEVDLEEQDYYNFTFNVPSGATISGIEAQIEASACSLCNGDGGDGIGAQLSWNGGTSYTTSKVSADFTTTDTNYTYGGPTDTWGRTWSDTELSNANFRIRLRANINQSSFPRDSLLLKADGKYYPIQDFTAGDAVLSYNTDTGGFMENLIISIETHLKDKIYNLNGEVKATGDELIYAKQLNSNHFRWIKVEDLVIGDIVLKEINRNVIETQINSIDTEILPDTEVITLKTATPYNNYWVNNYLFDPPLGGVGVDLLQVKVYYSLSSGAISWTQGKFGGGLNVNGGVGIGLSDDSSFDFEAAEDFTLGMWFKSNSETNPVGNEYLVNKQTGTGYSIYITSGGILTFGIDSDGTWTPADTAVSSTDVYDGKWHYLAAVKTGTSKIELYLDGLKVNSDDSLTANGNLSNSDSLTFGDSDLADNGDEFSGILDDIKIYRYARTTSQIVQDMNGGHPTPGSPIGSALVHLDMNDGISTVLNNSGNGGSSYNGTLGTSTAAPTWSNNGKYGKALVFVDDDADYASFSNDLFDTLTEGTISMWFKPTDTGDALQNLFSAGQTTAGNEYYKIVYDSTNNQIAVTINGCATDEFDFTANLSNVTSWHHLAFTVDSNGNSLYIDGTKQSPTYTSGSSTSTCFYNNWASLTNTYRLGCVAYNGTSCFVDELYDGHIDEFKVYNFALNPDQIKVEYNQGSALVMGAASTDSSGNPSWSLNSAYCPPGNTEGNCAPGQDPTPTAEYTFEENRGTTAYDHSGNGYNGTLHNTASYKQGKFGSAVYLDENTTGNDSHVQLPNSAFSSLSEGSISVWYNSDLTGASDWQDLLAVYSTGAGTLFELAYDYNLNRIHIYSEACSGTPMGYISGPTNKSGWHHVVYTSDSSGNKFYLDGVQKTATYTVGSATSTCFFDDYNGTGDENYAIGCYNYGAAPACNGELFVGKIDNVRIYDYARTGSQVAWEYNNGKPLAWWMLDDCTGTSALDDSGNNYTGTITIGASGTNTSAGTCSSGISTHAWNNGTSGKRNYSLSFDGTDDYISNSAITLPTADFTYAAWIYLDTLNVNRTVFMASDGSGNNELMLQIVYDTEGVVPSKVRFTTNGNSDYSQSQLSTGQWYHLAITRSGSTKKIYINGTLDATATDSSVLNFNGCQLYIGQDVDSGCTGTTGQFFDGKLDDLRVYNFALSPQQIRTVVNDGAVRFGD